MSDLDVVSNRCFSVEDYHRLADAGILAPDERVELLDGQIFNMLPSGPFHANSVRRLVNFFAGLSGGRWLVDIQNPVRLDGHSEPQPDFALLRPLTGSSIWPTKPSRSTARRCRTACTSPWSGRKARTALRHWLSPTRWSRSPPC